MIKNYFLSALLASALMIGFSAQAQSESEKVTTSETVTETLELNVTGMTCKGCEYKVKGITSQMEGVVSTDKVCHEGGKVILNYNPSIITKEQIVENLAEETGYGVVVSQNAAKTCDKSKKKCDPAKCDKTKKQECAKKSKKSCDKKK